MDTIRQEIREMRFQAKADFEFMTGALAHTAKQMTELGELVHRTTVEMSERMTQIEGRMRLHDQRFDRMLDAVDRAMGELPTLDQVMDMDRRLRALEQKTDSAA